MATKIIFSVVAGGLLLLHLIWPHISLDLGSVVLLVIALAPWAAPVIKSMEFPGGFKISFQDIQRATEKITSAEPPPSKTGVGHKLPSEARSEGVGEAKAEAGSIKEGESTTPAPYRPSQEQTLEHLRDVAELSPNLALVGLRVEIERKLKDIAEAYGIRPRTGSAGGILHLLQKRGVLRPTLAEGIRELVSFGNEAAHSRAAVSREAAGLALDRAPEVLGALDDYLTE